LWHRRDFEVDWRHGLSAEEFHELSRYNGESARGLVHTPEWRERMTVLQRRFDRRLAVEK
jgi:hypothetical protein